MDENRKPIVLYVPLDTDVISLTIVRNVEEELEDGGTAYRTSIAASCFNADVDAHDCLSGNSYVLDQEGDWGLIEDEEKEEIDINVRDEYEFDDEDEVEGGEDE